MQVLRDCLWNYTRDNVPSPALFNCDSTGKIHLKKSVLKKCIINYFFKLLVPELGDAILMVENIW